MQIALHRGISLSPKGVLIVNRQMTRARLHRIIMDGMLQVGNTVDEQRIVPNDTLASFDCPAVEVLGKISRKINREGDINIGTEDREAITNVVKVEDLYSA